MKRCTKCTKEHSHRHIGFADGCERYNECYNCCTNYGCIDAKKRGLIEKDGILVMPEEVQE